MGPSPLVYWYVENPSFTMWCAVVYSEYIPEGRGICGLTALVTLKEVLRQYQYLRKLPQIPRPCDVFDLAGGTGTGG